MNKDNPNIRALKLLHSFCPYYFPLLIAKSFFNKITPYFNLYFSAEIINEIIGILQQERLAMLIGITVFGNFIIAVISGILERAFAYSEFRLNQREAAYYIQKTLMLDYDDLENPDIRQLRRGITEAAQINGHGRTLLLLSIGRFINITTSTVFALILGLDMLVRMFSAGFHWYLVVFIIFLVVFIVCHVKYSFFVQEKVSILSREISQTMIDENRIDEALDCYNMGKDVRLYQQDKLIMQIKKYAFELHKKAFRVLAVEKFRKQIPLLVVDILLQIAIYSFVCAYVLLDIFGVGSIIKYVGFVQTLTGAIQSLFYVFGDIKYNTPFIEDYLAYFDIPQKMNNTSITTEVLHLEEEKDYEIEFRDVSFKYPGAEVYALNHVSIKFKVGEKLAIVGMNGSGKTTFIKLMCRLYEPTEGEILLNGVNIDKYDYNEYLSKFSVVFQDFKLFALSLGQNIAASFEYDKKKAYECCTKAGLIDRLTSIPHGMETCLYKEFEEDGIEISGGEAQKIALARALYKDAPFIILDEPTAALDPISEYEIYSRFNEITEGKTAIYISHRLASCRFCDNIAVFHNGGIVQIGSHDNLIAKKNGIYYDLWNAQAQYYI